MEMLEIAVLHSHFICDIQPAQWEDPFMFGNVTDESFTTEAPSAVCNEPGGTLIVTDSIIRRFR